MRILRASPILFLAALGNAPVEWSRDWETEQFRLKTALYFDCQVASDREPAKPFSLGLSYLVYGEEGRIPYQVNFIDPSSVLFQNKGWAPEGVFSLARLTGDGHLFVWNGTTKKGSATTIDMTLEVTPASGDGARATLSIVRFAGTDTGGSTAETFNGSCGALSGRAAWKKYAGEDE